MNLIRIKGVSRSDKGQLCWIFFVCSQKEAQCGCWRSGMQVETDDADAADAGKRMEEEGKEEEEDQILTTPVSFCARTICNPGLAVVPVEVAGL